MTAAAHGGCQAECRLILEGSLAAAGSSQAPPRVLPLQSRRWPLSAEPVTALTPGDRSRRMGGPRSASAARRPSFPGAPNTCRSGVRSATPASTPLATSGWVISCGSCRGPRSRSRCGSWGSRPDSRPGIRGQRRGVSEDQSPAGRIRQGEIARGDCQAPSMPKAATRGCGSTGRCCPSADRSFVSDSGFVASWTSATAGWSSSRTKPSPWTGWSARASEPPALVLPTRHLSLLARVLAGTGRGAIPAGPLRADGS